MLYCSPYILRSLLLVSHEKMNSSDGGGSVWVPGAGQALRCLLGGRMNHVTIWIDRRSEWCSFLMYFRTIAKNNRNNAGRKIFLKAFPSVD